MNWAKSCLRDRTQHVSINEKDHHHNGDHAARRPHMMSSICGRRLGSNFEGGLFDPSVLGVREDVGGWRWAYSMARPWVPIGSRLTHQNMVYLLPFSSYLAGSKSVPPVRPGYADKCRCRCYRFVERQKLSSTGHMIDGVPQGPEDPTCVPVFPFGHCSTNLN